MAALEYLPMAGLPPCSSLEGDGQQYLPVMERVKYQWCARTDYAKQPVWTPVFEAFGNQIIIYLQARSRKPPS
jgi:hypothetical protein